MAIRIGFALAALVATLAITACGSDDSGDSGDSGASTSDSTSGAQTVDASGKPSGELTISNWPLYIDKQTIPDFEDETGVTVKYIEDVNDNAEFFGKVQPQLDQGESGGPLDLRRHRLDGEQDARARLPAELRQVGDAEQPREPRAQPPEPAVRRQPRLLDAVADGDDRAGRAQGPGAGRDLDLRSVRLPVRGQGRDADRDARHRPAGDEVQRGRPRARRPSRTGSTRSRRSRTRSTRARSAASPATTTRAT